MKKKESERGEWGERGRPWEEGELSLSQKSSSPVGREVCAESSAEGCVADWIWWTRVVS
jgi:hypothetical protein